MQVLSPALEVIVVDPWAVCATAAGLYAKGISAEVHLYEGQRSDRSMIVHLGIPDDRDRCIRSFAFTAQLSPEQFTQPIQDLIVKITGVLQDQEDAKQQARTARAQQQAAHAAGPASGGIPIAQRFKVQPDGLWYENPPDPPVWVCDELRILGGTRDEHNDHHGHAMQFRDRYGELQDTVGEPLALSFQ
jgi:hypothetical protein